MKKKLTVVTILLILNFILPCISASNLSYKEKNNDNCIETNCIGHIEGRVGNSKGLYYWEPYIFALVDAEVKQTRTGLLGWYHLFLPLNQKYEITAYKTGYEPMTKEVTLTTKSPHREINFDFFESEPNESRFKDNKKPAFFGIIFGFTQGSFEHALWMLPFVKIEIEGRVYRSGFFGFFIISGLTLGETYKIKLSKDEYYNNSYNIKIDKYIQWLELSLMPEL
jgi:hypothetical protein